MAGPAGSGRGIAVMEQGDVYAVSLDPSQGHEQQGRRPVLIVSATAFNQVTRVPVVLPITQGGGFARTAGFAVELGAGNDLAGVIRCDQPRAIDLPARKARKIGRVPDAVLDEVLARMTTIFEQESR